MISEAELKIRDLPPEIIRQLISRSCITVGKLFYGEKNFISYGLTEQIDAALQRMGHGEGEPKQLILNCPPQCGKSASLTNFMAQYKANNPDKAVIYVTYGDQRANKIGQQTKDTFNAIAPYYDLKMDREVRSKKEWEVLGADGHKHRGAVIHRGTSEAITGYEADLVIVDDPYKGPEDSGSQTYRQTVKDLWESTISTRLAEDAIVIMTLTRWHIDDIVGHLLGQERQGMGDPWDKMIVPAIANEDIYTSWGMPIMKKGESPECRYSQEYFQKRKKQVDDWVWNALYMQKPMRSFGAMWPGHLFGKDVMLSCPRTPEWYAIGVDNATGSESAKGCWTAIVSIMTCGDGYVYVDADLSKSGPTETLDRLIRIVKAGPRIPDVIGIENFQFQDFIVEIGAERLYNEGIDCQVEGIGVEMTHPVTGKLIVSPQKEDRIAASLDPIITKGMFRFARTKGGAMLVSQLEGFPSKTVATDGPDALDIALRALQKHIAMVSAAL